MVSGTHQPVQANLLAKAFVLLQSCFTDRWRVLTNPFPGIVYVFNGEWIYIEQDFHQTCLSLLGLVIQSGVEVGALLQVLRSVALGRADFFVRHFNTGTGRQCNSSGDGGRGDDGEDIEVHGVYLGVDVSFQVLTVVAVE